MTTTVSDSRPDFARVRTLLTVPAIAIVLLGVRGYTAFREDHNTQIPALWKTLDPSLYPRDWFLNGSAHYSVRAFYLQLQRLLLEMFPSVEIALFSQYLFCLILVAVGLLGISRRFHGGAGLALAWGVLIAGQDGFANLGAAPVLERGTIPRQYAFAACYPALALLLNGHALVAGLLLGIAGLVQGAPTLQFLIVAVVWILVSGTTGTPARNRSPCLSRLRAAALLVCGFAAGYWPQVLGMRHLVLENQIYSPSEQIHYLAFIRHPWHMLPSEWETNVFVEALALLGFFLVAARQRGLRRRFAPAASLIGVLVAWCLLAVVFIEFVPVAKWIVFQPFRISAILRGMLLLFVAEHVLHLLRGETGLERARGAALALTSIGIVENNMMFLVCLVSETAQMLAAQFLPARWARRMSPVMLLAMLVPWYPYGRTRFLAILLIVAAAGNARFCRELRRLMPGPRTGYAAGAAALAAFLAVIVLAPFRKWDVEPSHWSRLDRLHYRLALRYQVYPFPNSALERAALWVRKNTPPDALILAPPEKTFSSFQIWSRRSIVFTAKTFPFDQRDWGEWIDRYLACRGIVDPRRQKDDVEQILKEPGMLAATRDFAALSSPQVFALANRYGAEYIVSSSGALPHSAQAHILAGPFKGLPARFPSDMNNGPFFVYKVPEK